MVMSAWNSISHTDNWLISPICGRLLALRSVSSSAFDRMMLLAVKYNTRNSAIPINGATRNRLRSDSLSINGLPALGRDRSQPFECIAVASARVVCPSRAVPCYLCQKPPQNA